VIYPGLASHPQHGIAMAQIGSGGTVIALDLKGGKEAAFRFLNALRIVTISNNLGDAKSIVTHPATTTHQRLSEETRAALGITPGLVRLSVGIEDPKPTFWPTSRRSTPCEALPDPPAPPRDGGGRRGIRGLPRQGRARGGRGAAHPARSRAAAGGVARRLSPGSSSAAAPAA
jgi:hypothetical protein